MPTQASASAQEQLQLIVRVDDKRDADDPFKLPAHLRTDVDSDLAALVETDQATAPAEGDRAVASGVRRRALTELARQLRGGFRFLGGIDEETISADERRKAMEAYGWKGGKVGNALKEDDKVVANARLALAVTNAEVPKAAHRYPAARLARITTQLGLATGDEDTASGGDRQKANRLRNLALETAETTALRVRFYYCSAGRDADQTPELTKIGFQPRRDPGTVEHGSATAAAKPALAGAAAGAPQG